MVEVGHVEPARIVAHAGEHELEREVESAWSAGHAFRVENPLVDKRRIAVEELADSELARHGLTVQERMQEIGGQALHVVDPIALSVQRAGQPVAGLDQAIKDITLGFAVDRRQFPPERKVVRHRSAQIGIARHLGDKVGRVLGKSAVVGRTISARIAEHERCGVTDPLMLHHIQVNVEAIGAQDGDAALQLLARAVAGRHRTLLAARADVVVVERPIPVRPRVGPGGGLQHWRQPDRGEAGEAQCVPAPPDDPTTTAFSDLRPPVTE